MGCVKRLSEDGLAILLFIFFTILDDDLLSLTAVQVVASCSISKEMSTRKKAQQVDPESFIARAIYQLN